MRAGAALLLLTTLAAAAEPLVIDVDEALATAWLVAEAEIVAVDRPQERGYVTVRVTRDPTRIYRGHRALGLEVKLPIPSGRAIKTWAHLAVRKGLAEPFLVIAHAGQGLVLGGYPDQDGYRVKGWSDFEDVQLVSHDESLVRPLTRNRVFLTRARLRERFREEGRRYWASVVRYIVTELPEPEQERFDEWIALLASSSSAERDYAQQALLDRQTLYIAQLTRAYESAEDPEARRRLRLILEIVEELSRVTKAVCELPPAHQAYVVREALPLLEGPLLDDARRWLARNG